ncbi:MAG: YwaF family protein [Mogibacterium sp.]|nr:YwaF family protein [Mogibacterium sp.]
MTDFITGLLELTAWSMPRPAMFGTFHIMAALISICAALVLAAVFRRHPADKVLSVTGWILVILELYKQLFLFFIVNQGAYDWWYFPFQLCSVPMYICILLPYTRCRIHNAMLTFLGSYALIGAAAALIFPEDFLRSYVTLTLHGFIWHGLLLFISIIALHAEDTDLSLRGFAGAAIIFIFLSFVAVLINIAAEPLMASAGLPESYAAMFYMNPYHISPQPVVSSVQQAIGIPAGLLLYALCIIAASGIIIRTAFVIREKNFN